MNRFDNGLDSLQRAINALCKQNKKESDYKEEIIFFHSAVEVLFKQLLYEINPLLLYPDVQETTKKAFNRRLEGGDYFKIAKQSLDDIGEKNSTIILCNNQNDGNQTEDKLHTIKFLECISRLVVASDIVISANIYAYFVRLNILRNSITHDELDFERTQSEQTVIDLLPTVIDICERKFDGDEKYKFSSLIEENINKIKQLYKANYINTINLYLSLLSTYSDKSYDNLTDEEKQKLYHTAELFEGNILQKGEVYLKIDNGYYTSLISYLNKKLCERIMLSNEFDNYKSSRKLLSLLQNNVVLVDVVNNYINKLVEQIFNLLIYHDEVDFIEKDLDNFKEQIYKHLNNEEFVINLFDIFQVVLQLQKAIERADFIIIQEKKKGKYSKTKALPNNEDIKIDFLIKTISEWYREKGWIDADNISENNASILEFINNDLLETLFVGLENNVGKIDRIDETSAAIDKIYCIIMDKEAEKENNMLTCRAIIDVSVESEMYYDGDYFPGGEVNLLILLKIKYNNKKYTVEEKELLDVSHLPINDRIIISL